MRQDKPLPPLPVTLRVSPAYKVVYLLLTAIFLWGFVFALTVLAAQPTDRDALWAALGALLTAGVGAAVLISTFRARLMFTTDSIEYDNGLSRKPPRVVQREDVESFSMIPSTAFN